jgi:hypothetical protein
MTDFTALTSAELLAFYNANSTKEVARFADRATAIRRCEALPIAVVLAQPRAHVHGTCPSCGVEDQVPAGLEGTSAGEHRSYCNYCYVTYENDTGKIVKDAKASTTRSAGIAASWTVAGVRAARSERTGVSANGMYFKSLAKAFAFHHVSMRGHIKRRMLLKATGQIEVGGITFKVSNA